MTAKEAAVPVSPAVRLALLPPARRANGVGASTVVAGLSMQERIRRSAERAGAAAAGSSNGGAGADGVTRLLLVPVNVVPQVAWLRSLVEMPVVPNRLYVDASGVAVVQTEDARPVLDAATTARTADEALGILGRRHETVDAGVGSDGRRVIEGAQDVRTAEQWLLRGLIKPDEGFMSRHFERRLSLALTRRLATTGVTPNAMTLVSLTIGLLAAPLFLSATASLQLAGALLFLAHSIIDGCDGELARLKFMESPAGAVLDFWGDNLVHTAVFTGMAVGWCLHTGAVWPLLVGVVAVASTLTAAGALAPQFVNGGHGGENRTLAGRLADALSHRDFIYLVLLLSAFGKAHWFLALTAVGTPLFLLLIWGSRAARR